MLWQLFKAVQWKILVTDDIYQFGRMYEAQYQQDNKDVIYGPENMVFVLKKKKIQQHVWPPCVQIIKET